MTIHFGLGVCAAVVGDEVLQHQHFVGLVELEHRLIRLGRILRRGLGFRLDGGGILRHGAAGGAGFFLDGLKSQPFQPVADGKLRRPILEAGQPLEDRRIDDIANAQVASRHRPATLEIGQLAPDGIVDRIEMILDQVEEELAPVRFRRIPRGRQRGADPAPAGGTLVFRLVLEARHMPIDLVAQVGKGLAQDRLDLESLFPRRDHARRQLQAQADFDALLAPRLRGNDFEPDQILAKARKVRFKLPHLFLDDLRRALLAVPVEIAE